MERNGQQLRCSNGIINSAARESKIGYHEIYRNKNTCLCMHVKDKKSEISTIPECNGTCEKQNINIFIDNYETSKNPRKYDTESDLTTIDSYPFYKSVKSEGRISAINNLYVGRNLTKNKSMYSDTVWSENSNIPNNTRNWESVENGSNVTFYPYLNNRNQYINEQNECLKTETENNSSINHVQVDILPGDENSLLENNIIKNYMCRGNTVKGKQICKSVSEQCAPFIDSVTTASSTCNNLYVAPPYFTVEKFVNQERTDIRRNIQSGRLHSQNCYSNQKMPSHFSFDYNAPGDQIGSTLLSNKQQHIEIELSDAPIIEPNGFDIHKQHRYLPIKKEDFNCEKDIVSAKIKNYQWDNNIHLKVPYSSNPNIKSDFIKNSNNPMSFSIEKYNRTDSIELENENLYGIAEFRATYNTPGSSEHTMAFRDLQYTQYQRNGQREVYTKKTCSSILPSSTKNVVRDTRKPNYRELINHVHALRSATSEDDLNMQIIKRTLNYNQQPKDPPNPVISRKFAAKAFRRNEETKLSRNQHFNAYGLVCDKSFFTSHEHQHLQSELTNIVSPLDLSVKTIKTNADSTENNSKCKVLYTENCFPPKFNFKPDFSESQNFKCNTGNIDKISNTVDINLNPSKNLSKVNINIQDHLIEYRNQTDNVLATSIPNICSLENYISTENVLDETKQESEQNTDIKLEVTLKRKIPLYNEEDNDLVRKQICVENFHHSDFKAPCNKLTEDPNIISKTSSSSFSFNYVTNSNKKDLHSKPTFVESELVSKNEPAALQNNFTELKQNVSCIIAARIRTKAELKGFTFQEEKEVCQPKPLSNKEYCHCNYDIPPSVQIDEVDLNEWGNACNNFVDQLKNNSKTLRSDIKDLKLYENKITRPIICNTQYFDSENNRFFEIHKSNLFEYNNSSDTKIHEDEFRDVKAVSDSNSSIRPTSPIIGFPKSIDMISNNNIQVKTHIRGNENNNNKIVSIKCEQHLSNDEPKCGAEDFLEKKKSFTRNKNKEQNILGNDSRAINLTKISVVRLKREKYASKRYTCDKNINFKSSKSESNTQLKANEDLTTGRHMYNMSSFPGITKTTLRRKNMSIEYGRRKQQNLNTGMENKEPKVNKTVTRLRHQRLLLKHNTESIENNKKTLKSKSKSQRLHRFTKSNERELSNDSDKLYLEVYRYKRALKIPPNLITIRNPCTQRMSASLPDLDIDLHTNLLKTDTLHINNDHEVENVPKSIIDVLHSRVVKSKCQVKTIQKHFKTEHHHTAKLTKQRCNNSKLNFEPLNICENNKHSYREHRNVFETQVLTSRTRMEYKMQLNKEVIREIFGGSERPASAPPEINNINGKVEIGFENSYNKCFHQLIENKIDSEPDTSFTTCVQTNLDDYVINNNTNEQIKDSIQGITPNKCKRKRNGRTYRRKLSSGFDYLRKRKKSNPLFNYPHLKTRPETYITEANLKLKSEKDVSREIQKWVLNKGVGQSALHKAARLGYIDVIVYCLEKMGLNPDHKDNAGYTPLHDACINGSLEIARVLLQYGANHSEGAHSGIRPLHEACENGHLEIVRMLLSYGADPLLETYSGQTPLMLASDQKLNNFIQMHLVDVQVKGQCQSTWRLPGPWKIFDDAENGYDAFHDASALEKLYHMDGDKNFTNKAYAFHYFENKNTNYGSDAERTMLLNSRNQALKNDICEFEIFVDAVGTEGELFEFEESNMPLPPLYLLKDEGMEKWVLLSDLCSLLKVKSKDTLLNKIFPSISPTTVSRTFMRELKMCEFLEKATCLQLLCAGEKINICHSKVVLIQYNENVRKLLGVKTIFMKF